MFEKLQVKFDAIFEIGMTNSPTVISRCATVGAYINLTLAYQRFAIHVKLEVIIIKPVRVKS